MLWVFATLVAAGAQTARNAMQSSLTKTLGTLGATHVRFLYGLPFAAAFLALAAAVAGTDIPGPTGAFLAFTLGGAMAQIAGTALLLAAMQERSFVIATAGVVLIAAKPGIAFGSAGARPVVYGIASGACFAIASVGFRGGILELGTGVY